MSLVSQAQLRALAEARDGWHVSLYMPIHPPGFEAQQNPIRLKNLLDTAEEQLISGGVRSPDARDLLAQARGLVTNGYFWRYQSAGLAIFCSQELFRRYRLSLRFGELVVVDERFHIKPLLPLLSGDGHFYMLALSQNEIRLLQGSRSSVAVVELEDVPESLADALRWDDPERQLQWHTGTGSRADGRAAIFHGHGVGTDNAKTNIRRYFQQVDDGICRILAEDPAPLVLAGVDYLLPIYRSASDYPNLVEGAVTGNPEELSDADLHQAAWRLVQPRFAREEKAAEARYRQLAGTGRAITGLDEVLAAAHHGRVETLFVARDRHQWGLFDRASQRSEIHAKPRAGDEDLLDLAAVQTLLQGGTIYVVELEQMPAAAELAAILRY
jgi:hypothetical protein